MTKICIPEPLISSEDNPNLYPLVLSNHQTNTDMVINTFESNRIHNHRNMKNHRQKHRNMKKNNKNNDKNDKNNIKILSASEQRQREMDREEMQSLLAKLKQLVPGIPKHRRLSKLEIIQHVIDYIFDLQTALESHPIASSMAIAADFVTSGFVSSWPSTAVSSLDSSTTTISCDRYFSTNNNTNGLSPQQPAQQPILPQRIPGSNRQPLASIVL